MIEWVKYKTRTIPGELGMSLVEEKNFSRGGLGKGLGMQDGNIPYLQNRKSPKRGRGKVMPFPNCLDCGAPRLYPSSVADFCRGRAAVAPPQYFGGTRRSIPSFAKATEGYPQPIHPRVYTRSFMRRWVNRPTPVRLQGA